MLIGSDLVSVLYIDKLINIQDRHNSRSIVNFYELKLYK